MPIFFEEPWFAISTEFIASFLPKMRTKTSIALYVFLCAEMNRLQKPDLRFTYDEIRERLPLAKGSLGTAVKELQSLRLVRADRGIGGVYRFWLLDPRTGVVCRNRSIRKAPDANLRPTELQPPSRPDQKPPSDAATDFAYGWNVAKKGPREAQCEEAVMGLSGLFDASPYKT